MFIMLDYSQRQTKYSVGFCVLRPYAKEYGT